MWRLLGFCFFFVYLVICGVSWDCFSRFVICLYLVAFVFTVRFLLSLYCGMCFRIWGCLWVFAFDIVVLVF